MKDDDEITALNLVDEDGNPIGYPSIGEAAAALRAYLEDGGTFEVHADGCDGTRGMACDCGVEMLTSDELYPKVQA